MLREKRKGAVVGVGGRRVARSVGIVEPGEKFVIDGTALAFLVEYLGNSRGGRVTLLAHALIRLREDGQSV